MAAPPVPPAPPAPAPVPVPAATKPPTSLALIVPTLNAAATLGAMLDSHRPLAAAETVVVDGGSRDGTLAVAVGAGARVIVTDKGRGRQLRSGAAASRSDWLLFQHADTRLGPGAAAAVHRFVADPANRDKAACFRFRLDHAHALARYLEWWVAVRVRRFALPYGDQGLLIARALYDALGGYRPMPLMEDVDLVQRIGRARLVALDADAITSAVRFRREGYLVRGARNLLLYGLFRAGVSPDRLARMYS